MTTTEPAAVSGALGLGEWLLREAVAADLAEMDSLRRTEQEAVGFIPMSRYEDEVERQNGTVLVMHENGDMVGYLYWTRGMPLATIQQTVIRKDARRRERATALVEAGVSEMAKRGHCGVTCRCRLDLEAVAFWEAIGFERIRIEEGGRRGPLVRFYRPIVAPLLEPIDFVRDAKFGRMALQRKGFRAVKA